MEDKFTELLSRATANHLFLAQFEAFRANLLSLRARNPDLALSILQTLVSAGGRLPKVLWSPSCPSPSLLTYLSTLELLQFNDSSSIWSFDPDSLRLRVEFLLFIQTISSRVSESLRKVVDLEGIEKDADKLDSEDSRAEFLTGNGELKEVGADSGESLRVLDRLSDLGVNRLKPDLVVVEERESGGSSGSGDAVEEEEEELMCLRRVILDNADVFDVLSVNIQKQIQCVVEHDDSGLAITLQRERKLSEEDKEEDVKVLKLIQRIVQIVHLDAMKECLIENDEEGVLSHVRFLHLEYGVEETEYRMVLQDLLKRVLSRKAEYGDNWIAMRDKLLLIYGEALSSNCIRLVQMIQVIHDDLLAEEIEMFKASDNNHIPPPLEHLQSFIANLKPETKSDEISSVKMATHSCMSDMYHYARVSGLHVLECVMDTALSAVKREQLQEASTVRFV